MSGTNDVRVLPDDITFEILVRLPVKSLLQFKSVCRHWHSIISSPSFVRRHLHHESNRTRLLVHWSGLLPPYDGKTVKDCALAVSLFTDETLERHEEPDHLKLPWDVFNVTGPCNGIFVIYSFAQKLALWNPATRRLRPLPNPPHPTIAIGNYGFGVDPQTDELKIVMFHGTSCFWSDYAIYTSRNDSWRYFEKEPFFDHRVANLISGYESTFLNGFCYWLEFDTTESPKSVIFAFDMHNEVFQEIQVPETVKLREKGVLGFYGGSLLALFSFHEDNPRYEPRVIDIWTMREDRCWTKLSTVILPFEFRHPIGFWKRDRILVATTTLEEMMCDQSLEIKICDLNGQDIRKLRYKRKGKRARYQKLCTLYYKESLTSVNEGRGFEDYDIYSPESSEFFLV